ncbi:outer membrane receptor protein [Opitutaceae bacterium TAV1]|nr:outer membrane receptor protein [Opitutaceae bacterium TAV1]
MKNKTNHRFKSSGRHVPPRLASLLLGLMAASCGYAQTATEPEVTGELEEFVVGGTGDPNNIVPNRPIDTLGLSKKIVDTPRSISTVSGETIEKFNITELADLSRFSPSTYTAFSFGVQGGLQIRGDTADTYFGDIRKINNAANVPTIIGASDGITIVRGPSSAVLGIGSVGGFMNYLPKSARASTGKYLERLTGKVSMTFDDWGKRVATAEVGGPATIFGKKAGFYIYTQGERSDTYYKGQEIEDEVIQATLTIDLTDALRMEIGGNYQHHEGTGIAGWNRVTQDLVDHRTYQTGSPDFSLIDTNGDGVASREELYNAGLTNNYNFSAPGVPVPNQVKPGTDAYTAPGGPLAFVTDVGTSKLSPRNVLLERVNYGVDYIGYIKLINDSNPDLVFKNILFFEHQKYHKLSDIAYFRAGDTKLFEERVSVDWHVQGLPDWLKINNMSAFNIRYLDARNSTTNVYQLFNYWDLKRYTDGRYYFQNGWDNPDEAGVDSDARSEHTEIGLGNVLDVTMFDRLNLNVGVRFDWVDAEVKNYPGLRNSGNVLTPTPASSASGREHATSLTSASLSYRVLPNIVPYVTYAEPKTIVPGTTGGLSSSQVNDEILTDTQLKEAGIKGEFFNGKLFVSYAIYEQYRTAFVQSLNGGNGDFQQTRSKGQEVEVRWAPTRNFNMAIAADWMRRDNDPLAPGFTPVPADTVGLDPIEQGGGRYQLAYDPNDTRVPRPKAIYSLFGNYIFGDSGFDVSAGVNYTAGYKASNIGDIKLPSALTFSLDVGYQTKRWEFRVSGKNLTNELFFTSTSGSAALIPQPGRTFTAKVTYKF